MPRFLQERDNLFFQKINHELIDNVMEVQVIIYKLIIEESPLNIYGEAPEKVFRHGVWVMCRVDRQATSPQSEGYGADVTQRVSFEFQRETLADKGIYPEPGDIVEYDKIYYEIDNTNETQLIGGQPSYKHSIVADAHMTRRTALQLEEPNS